MIDNRLPKILAKETIVKDIYWASKLKSTCSEFDIVFVENHKNTAKRSQFHDAYTNLSYVLELFIPIRSVFAPFVIAVN